MSMPTDPVFALAAGTQSYDWGKLGSDSKAAQFAKSAAQPGFQLDESKPYAELWMGTHVSMPSKLQTTSDLLSDHLKSHPELIGSAVSQKFAASNGTLPFLFKILAIRKALSIQSHPDKKLAERLHKERPDLYKDDNHKPEMAIALTEFRALCGFRPLHQIADYLQSVPELAALIPPTILTQFISVAATSDPHSPEAKAALKDVWSALMTASPEKVKKELGQLISRYKSRDVKSQEESLRDLAITVESQFPGDIGVFCVFVLNVLDLEPGEAIFLGAGEPHAYISGDIVETMATSDNVLRAGLTPKHRDVVNLVGSLTYSSSSGSKHAVKPSSFAANTQLYDAPIPEFSVLRTSIKSESSEEHRAILGPSVAIVTGGAGSVMWDDKELTLTEGTVFFIGAGQPVTFRSLTTDLQIYRAFVEI